MSRDQTRADYLHFLSIPTRWMDNDIYGHVNNVVYYSYVASPQNSLPWLRRVRWGRIGTTIR